MEEISWYDKRPAFFFTFFFNQQNFAPLSEKVPLAMRQPLGLSREEGTCRASAALPCNISVTIRALFGAVDRRLGVKIRQH